MNKVLSIVLPTYNRAEILKFTLSILVPQMEEVLEDVELVICNNASTDETKETLIEFHDKYNYVKIINYEEHLDIGNSIARSIANASGDYFLLWSDDDIPAPFMIKMYLNAIKNNSGVACVVGNRLVGETWPDGFGIKNLRVHGSEFTQGEVVYESSDAFVRQFAGAMGFLSVDLIRRDIWEKNKDLSKNDCWGYEFLLPMLAGLKNEQCIYLSFPTCIQRFFVNPRYIDKWVTYAYIGMPRLLQRLETMGVITDWYDGFKKFKYNQSDIDFINSVRGICWNNREIYIPLIDELLNYQKSSIRRFFIKSIQRPKFMYVFYELIYDLYRIMLLINRVIKSFAGRMINKCKLSFLTPCP